jgi:AraC family transcriptional regulator
MEYDCPYTRRVGQLAAQVGLSRSRFQHLFRQETGETFSARLREVRLKKALALLADFHLSIKEVAGQCGYSSATSFARDFRKLLRVPPSEFRRSTI